MSYKVIARKYRPSTFEEVIGQDHITKTIAKSIVNKKIAHAYLFSGAHGVGKTSLARIIAKSLNCEHGPTDTPCGICPSCAQIADGTPLDVIEIDGASNRGIDNIRSIIENSRISPVSGKYKIYIIDEVHQITTDAFNALLKTLEEPPSHVVFILATTEADKVLSTIKSRCQQYTFKNLSIEDIEKILKHILSKENIQYEDEAIFLIAKNARGSVRDAETILEKMIAYTSEKGMIKKEDVLAVVGGNNFEHVNALFNVMLDGDKKKYFEFTANMSSNGVEPKTLLINIIEYMHVVLMMKAGIEDIRVLEVTESEKNDLSKFTNRYTSDELERILDYILSMEEKVRYAASPRIIFEARGLFLLDVNNLIRPVDIIALSSSENSDVKTDITVGSVDIAPKHTALSQNTNTNPEEAKRESFYTKILNCISSESSTVYSMLSQGVPKGKDGTTLIVELPENIYNMIDGDKRINDLLLKAISMNTKNPSVRINFTKKKEENDIMEKLKKTFSAEDENYE